MEIFRPALAVRTVFDSWPLSLAVAAVQDLVALGMRQPTAPTGRYELRVQYRADQPPERASRPGAW